MKPSIGRIVHYVSFGTPVRPDGTQAYTQECRAAIVTAVPAMLSEGPNTGPEGYVPSVSLCVLNPTGLFFHEESHYDDGAELAGDPDCPDQETHGNPFRYCACGWGEATYSGGTWHWPEQVED